MKKIYLSGPVSGRPLEEARVQFAKAEEFLLKHFGRENVEVFNPMKFTTYAPEKKWQDYMHLCLAVLEQCDVIVLLDDWTTSKGSCCEYWYAQGCGIETWALLTANVDGKTDITIKKQYEFYIGLITDLPGKKGGCWHRLPLTDEHRGHAVVDDSEQPNSL